VKGAGIIALLKGKNKPKRTAPAPPDPAIEFPHSENASRHALPKYSKLHCVR
jgi:hypothetical protein